MPTAKERARQAIDEARRAGVPEETFEQMCERFKWALASGPGHPNATVEQAVLEVIKPLLSSSPEPQQEGEHP